MKYPVFFIDGIPKMNEMDIDVSVLNQIDKELKAEICCDNELQIMCEECSEVIEDNDKLNKIDKAHEG